MKKFFKEFREFAMRGNVLDMAIGVVLGSAFGKITTSLVNDIINPILGILTGGNESLSALAFQLPGGGALMLGNFINAQSSADNTIGAILDVYFDKTTQPYGSSSITIRDPKLHCVISQYEAGYKNIRVIPYSQYTDELGAAHGVFTLSRAYIESVLYGAIDEQFITLD